MSVLKGCAGKGVCTKVVGWEGGIRVVGEDLYGEDLGDWFRVLLWGICA